MVRLFIIVFLILFVIVMVFYSLKNRLLFHPDVLAKKPDLPHNVEESFLEVEPGVQLAVYHTKDTTPTKQKPVVYSHGNAGNALGCMYLFKYSKTPLVVWDYRGFGRSGGQATEQNVVQDLDKVVQWTADKYEVPRNKIVLWGRSIGTNVVMQYVDRCMVPPSKVILHTPFSKLSDVMRCMGYGWLGWLCYLVGNMDVRKNMQRLVQKGGKALVIASQQDNVTPWQSALELVVSPAVRLKEVTGSHYTAFEDWPSINNFIDV